MLTTAVNSFSLVPLPQSFVTAPQLRAKGLYLPQLSSLSPIHKTVIYLTRNRSFTSVQSCLSNSSSTDRIPRFNPSTRLFVSELTASSSSKGLSFRTTEESLRNAFKNYGELVEVNLVMDKIANRPRGFAFLRYASEEESNKAIEGMHGKFLDGRVIFVEVAKSRAELRKEVKNQQR